MKIVSVNVGLPREVVWKGVTFQTAIFKEPVAGAAAVREPSLHYCRQALEFDPAFATAHARMSAALG